MPVFLCVWVNVWNAAVAVAPNHLLCVCCRLIAVVNPEPVSGPLLDAGPNRDIALELSLIPFNRLLRLLCVTLKSADGLDEVQ